MLAVTNPQKDPAHLDSKSTKDFGPDDLAHLFFFRYDSENPPVNRNSRPFLIGNHSTPITNTPQETH